MTSATPDVAAIVDRLIGPGGPFEIGEATIGGRVTPVWRTAPSDLRELLLRTARFDEREVLVYEDERWTFAGQLQDVASLATWLAAERGVGAGDRIAIGMRNYPEFVLTFWAAHALGAVVVPLNAWWTAPELRYALDDSAPVLAVLDGERYARVADDLLALALPAVVVRHDGPIGAADVHWADVRAALDPAATMPDGPIDPDDPATILYTSGTTGEPKGAVGTHRNHVSTYFNTAFNGALGVAVAKAAAEGQSGRGDGAAPPRSSRPPSALLTYPFFHIGGLNALCINTAFGVKSVLQYKWDTEEVLATIEREQVTRLAAVPTLLRALLESPLLAQYDTSSLESLASGGAPVPPDLVDRIDQRGAAPSNGYGLTETTGAVTINVGRDYVAHADSVGRPFPVTSIRVVDPPTGEEVAPGAVGELCFAGPTVVQGYWNKPAATAASFVDGWFHSGDLGYVDDEGFAYVVDRLKDVIIRGGENIYSAEIEAVLFEHPDVGDVAVIGVPHDSLGEEVCAVVVAKPGTDPSVDALRDHVAARLAYFKVPTQFAFRTAELPRNATGKVLKRELRDELVR